jgi:hypothetical protein
MLHEEILLLALDDVKGTVPLGTMHAYGMAGGIMTELLLRGSITVERVKKSLMVDVADDRPTGDALLDDVLTRIRSTKRRASLNTWVTRVAGTKMLEERVADGLRDLGILRREERRMLLFFRRTTWPEQDGAPKTDLLYRICAAVEADGAVDPRTATVIALAKACGLLRLNFAKADLKAHKERIEDIVSGNAVGDAAREAVEAVTAAMIATSAAVTAATTAATAAS